MNEDEKDTLRGEIDIAIEDCQTLLAQLRDPNALGDWDYYKDRTEDIGYRLGSIAHPSEL